MTRERVTKIILTKARDLQDFDYYIRQMIIDGHIKMLFPCSLISLLFILKKAGVIRLESYLSIPDGISYLFILGIPYFIYRISVNRSPSYEFPNLGLYSYPELLIMARGLNRKRRMMKRFVNARAPWKFLQFVPFAILAACVKLVYQYSQKKADNAAELIVVMAILLSFALAMGLILKRDAHKFDYLQKQIYMKSKNVIFDHLILSKLNPFNHATTRSDK